MKRDDYVDIIDFTIEKKIEAARDGDQNAGMRLIEIFTHRMEIGDKPNQQLLEYFTDSFNQILKGSEPRQALNISKPTHRPENPDITERNHDISFDVEIEILKGNTIEEARAKVASKYKRSESTIKQAHEKYRDKYKLLAELLSDQIDN